MAEYPQATADEVDKSDAGADLCGLLTSEGFIERGAHYIIQRIEDMASAKLIARFETEVKGLRAEMRAQNSKYTVLLWLISALLALGLLTTFIPGLG